MGLNSNNSNENLEKKDTNKNPLIEYFSRKFEEIFKKTNPFKERVLRTLEDEEIRKLLLRHPNILKKMEEQHVREDILLRVDSREKIYEVMYCLSRKEIEKIIYDTEIISEIRFIILKKMYRIAIHENIFEIYRKIEGDNIEKGILNYIDYHKVRYIYDKKEKVCLMSFGDRMIILKNIENSPKKINDEKYEVDGKFFNHFGSELES